MLPNTKAIPSHARLLYTQLFVNVDGCNVVNYSRRIVLKACVYSHAITSVVDSWKETESAARDLAETKVKLFSMGIKKIPNNKHSIIYIMVRSQGVKIY